jgi:hypothetical protein
MKNIVTALFLLGVSTVAHAHVSKCDHTHNSDGSITWHCDDKQAMIEEQVLPQEACEPRCIGKDLFIYDSIQECRDGFKQPCTLQCAIAEIHSNDPLCSRNWR